MGQRRRRHEGGEELLIRHTFDWRQLFKNSPPSFLLRLLEFPFLPSFFFILLSENTNTHVLRWWFYKMSTYYKLSPIILLLAILFGEFLWILSFILASLIPGNSHFLTDEKTFFANCFLASTCILSSIRRWRPLFLGKPVTSDEHCFGPSNLTLKLHNESHHFTITNL